MRIKALLTSILLASTTIAGVASASPRVRDHRGPARSTYPVTYRRAPYQSQVSVQTRPSWMINANVNYGFQLAANGTILPYTYGNDPYVEGIARGEWTTLNPCIDLAGHSAERVALAGRSLQSVEFQATRGDAYVYTVGVIFRDGSQESFHIKRTLDATHEPNLRLDLGAKGMAGVNAIVFDAVGNGSFRMLGA